VLRIRLVFELCSDFSFKFRIKVPVVTIAVFIKFAVVVEVVEELGVYLVKPGKRRSITGGVEECSSEAVKVGTDKIKRAYSS